MRFMWFWLLLLFVLLFMAYVRLAPSDPARWHRGTGVETPGEEKREGSYVWREAVTGDGTARLAEIDRAAMATPRTSRLAGSVEEGKITYVTRTRLMGFPDYTTVGLYGSDPRVLEMFGRKRFGRSDFGVNAARLRAWRGPVE
jgi:site-specific DNA-cytosine methylase